MSFEFIHDAEHQKFFGVLYLQCHFCNCPIMLSLIFSRQVDWFSLTAVILLLCFAPGIVFFFIMTCDQYQCSISHCLIDLYSGESTLLSVWDQTPSITWTAAKIYSIWVLFQVHFSLLFICFCSQSGST